ncbi:MAG: hypothetical protein A3J66_03590 [Candidatus Magasanikbacteria bacterium RIFCSPHIGHO2_02_FULL_47_14]|uniref:GIY-YIG domain-containing protein n=1 Tax=Candidatus Magasanikbacteria bacterium RIFCSPHIGHO2_02_FULL_47_14 TaxID=1798680 RepID=A0A1F6M784_9BACT|nr:MAG: hypothetical protein A3J66_03590 [Candidatus Magasanikbacteria bacterium RIFCSPHIGHO2_02_FULL_47_14]
MFYTYVIKNDVGNIYIGYTSDLENRLKRHNGLMTTKKKSYTHRHKAGKWTLVLTEKFSSRVEAIRRERELKSYQGRKYIRQVIEEQNMGR